MHQLIRSVKIHFIPQAVKLLDLLEKKELKGLLPKEKHSACRHGSRRPFGLPHHEAAAWRTASS
jgi:hypothetical protein